MRILIILTILIFPMFVFAGPNVPKPFQTGTRITITKFTPSKGATEANCATYRDHLINKSVIFTIPSSIHSGNKYSVFLNNKEISMISDNGWGPPWFLYAANIKVNNFRMSQVFIEFTNKKRNKVKKLVMRTPFNPNSSVRAHCRIIGIPE